MGQKELATEFYLSNKSVVSAYERGTRTVPAEIIMKYAEKFGVTTDWIMNGDPDKHIDIERLSAIPGFEEIAAIYSGLDSAMRSVAVEQMKALTKLTQR